MTFGEQATLAALIVQCAGLAVVLFKVVWGSASSHESQFSLIKEAFNNSLVAVEGRLLSKIDNQSTNIGNVVANISDRIHKLELKAMEFRAQAAETYMRRDSYHKATDEFKRDVRDAHIDLKKEMHAGFGELKDQINAVSMSIEENRKAAHRAPA